jgi:nicotinamide riboside kinase
MNIDLPWENDPLRDFPNQREYFMNVWHAELQALNANYTLISGNDRERLANAISAVDYFLTNSSR